MSDMKDSDTSLWLYNKLGTSNDTWIGGSICSQLNVEVLRNIRECFIELQTQVKLKLLLSFLHIPRRHIEEWQTEVEQVLTIATQDSDQWVSVLAEMMQTFPATGSLNTDIRKAEEKQEIFADLIDELKGLLKQNLDLDLLPLECHYLNKTAFGQIVQPERHFRLRRRPRAASLRAELLHRAEEASGQLARQAAAAAAAGAVPLRSRSAPRRPDSAGPSSRAGGERGPSSGDRRRSLPSLSSAPHSGRTVKMLDIAEQPTAPQHGKRRRKSAEERASASGRDDCSAATREPKEPATPAAKEKSPQQLATAATPDYAAGLQSTHLPVPAAGAPTSAPAPAPTPAPAPVPDPVPAQPPAPTAAAASAPSLAPAPAQPPTPTLVRLLSQPPPVPPPKWPPPCSCAHSAVSSVPSRGGAQTVPGAAGLAPSLEPQRPAPAMYAPQPPQQQTSAGLSQHRTGQRQTSTGQEGATCGSELPQPNTTTQPPQQETSDSRPHLTLSRDQMLKAQEMFSTANLVTRPEKALILGFMAGSRDNPCPHLGDVVTIKLSEAADAGQGGSAVVAETHFQMNYRTGEWKRVKKFRRIGKTVG